MTECNFGLTICAEEQGQLNYECPNPPVKNIAGPYDDRLVCLDFCVEHYQKVSEWIKK